MGDFRTRKLASLALISLLKVPPLLRDHRQILATVITVVSGVLIDEQNPKGSLGPIKPDADEVSAEDFQTDLQRASASVRYWDLLYNKDPINKISIKHYLSQTLNELQAKDPNSLQLLLQSIHPKILNDLQNYIANP